MSANQNNDNASSMLVVFDLFILNNIYKSVNHKIKLSAMSKMVYQSCITHYFIDKPLKMQFNQSFRLSYDLAKHESFREQYSELFTAGLISYEKETIDFPAVWINLINQNHFKNDRNTLISKIDEYETEILNNVSLLEVAAMKNQLQIKQVKQLLKLFVLEQKAVGVVYNNTQDAIKHFNNWIRYNKDQTTNVVAKSKAQIIGLDPNKK